MAGQSVVASNSQSPLKIFSYQQDQTGQERSTRSSLGRSEGSRDRPTGSQGVKEKADRVPGGQGVGLQGTRGLGS